MKIHPMLGSSTDPTKLSLTIKSLGIWLIPAVIFIGKYYEVNIAEADLTTIINTLAMVGAGLMTTWGVIRKYL